MLSCLFYRNPRLTALSVGLILVAGLAALQALPRQEDPALTRRFATITTFYRGASALRVEALVTEKIEAQLQELGEIEVIDSLSRSGVSVIFLELGDRYSEEVVDEIWSKVRDKLADAEAELPAAAAAPEFEDKTSTAVTLLVALLWVQDESPQLALLSRLAEELENRLRNLSGTRETELFGEAQEEIRVGFDPLVLASVNLTAAQVARAIARADAKVPAGQLRHGANHLLLEVAGEIDSLDRIRRIPLREARDGRVLRVGDVASVTKTIHEPPSALALIGGRRGVAVAATMEPDRRVDDWARGARAVVEEFRREVPTGVVLETIFDQSVYTDQRLSTRVGNLLLGAFIVVCVLVFMMGPRSALAVASALPLTVAMVLAELRALGVPLHQVSISGLIIALGLLIDNAIVVVDEYDMAVRGGAARGEAISRVVGRLFVPLAASTLTTVLAFLPIVLMPGADGEFVGTISVGVGLAVTSSFLLSMTVVPALAGYLTPRSTTTGGAARDGWRAGYSSPKLTALYRRSLLASLRRPAIGIGVSLILPLLGLSVAPRLGQQFFPANDRNQFQVELVLPAQASIEQTRAHVWRAREILHAHPEIVSSHWFLGEAAPRVYYNMINNEDGVASYAGGFVTTRSADATERLLPDLQRELIDAFPGAQLLALPFEQGPPFDAPIEVRLVGPDLGELRRLGEQVRALLAQTDAVTYTAAKLSGGEPKLILSADEDRARIAGLRLVDIADQLEARLEGALGGTFLEATEEIPVRVRVAGVHRRELAAIAAGRVLPAARAREPSKARLPGAPLMSLAGVELVPELSGINRRNGERVNTVQAFLAPYALVSDSLADFLRRLEASEFSLPEGYRLELGGENEERTEALRKLAAFALPLFVLMAGSIVLTFNSFRRAAIIFGVAVLSVGLALLGVWTFGYPLGFVAIVGTMGLVGLAINDAIVVLTALRFDARACAADVEGTADVVVKATRHVLATTLTTIGGFSPLILFGGRFWPPMATAIAGGVAGASILALYFVPALFIAICRRDLPSPSPERIGRSSGSSPAAATARIRAGVRSRIGRST